MRNEKSYLINDNVWYKTPRAMRVDNYLPLIQKGLLSEPGRMFTHRQVWDAGKSGFIQRKSLYKVF